MDICFLCVEATKSINWPAIVPAVASIWTAVIATFAAIIATRALSTWKKQIRAQKQIEFMDQLTDIVHEYIQTMAAPIQRLEFTKIGIRAYSAVASIRHGDTKNAGVISYIEKKGKADQEKFLEYLDKLRPMESRMSSLATKGQALGFKNYDQCHHSCEMLAWSYRQLVAVAQIIGETNLNWENPDVQQALDEVMSIDAAAIRKNLEEQNTAFLVFVKQSYQSLLG